MRTAVTALALALALPGLSPAASKIDGIVLRVDNRMATLSEYIQRRGERVQQILGSELAPEEQNRLLEEAGRSVLLEIYQELLLLARADQLGIRISTEELERNIDQTRQRMGLETTGQLEQALAESGRSLDDLRERTRINLLVQDVVGREVQAKALPGEEEIRRYYREHPELFTNPASVRIREVIVRAEAFPDGASLEEAAARMRAAFDAGTLESVAEAGSASGQTTGVIDLDWVSTRELDEALRVAVADAPAGAKLGPVAARGGLHLIEVLERREAAVRPLSEVELEIKRTLGEGRFDTELEALINRLEEQAWIVVNAPDDAVGFLAETETPAAPAAPPAAAQGP
jgi:peptidyl-prolyl cis-trans isomerase SurA